MGSLGVHGQPKFGLGPRKVFPPKCGQGLEGEDISALVFEKNLLNVLVPSYPQLMHLSPTSPFCHQPLALCLAPSRCDSAETGSCAGGLQGRAASADS